MKVMSHRKLPFRSLNLQRSCPWDRLLVKRNIGLKSTVLKSLPAPAVSYQPFSPWVRTARWTATDVLIMLLVSFGFCQDSYASVIKPLFSLVHYQGADHVDIVIVFSISPAASYTRIRRRGSKASGAVSPPTLLKCHEGVPRTVLLVAVWPRLLVGLFFCFCWCTHKIFQAWQTSMVVSMKHRVHLGLIHSASTILTLSPSVLHRFPRSPCQCYCCANYFIFDLPKGQIQILCGNWRSNRGWGAACDSQHAGKHAYSRNCGMLCYGRRSDRWTYHSHRMWEVVLPLLTSNPDEGFRSIWIDKTFGANFGAHGEEQ